MLPIVFTSPRFTPTKSFSPFTLEFPVPEPKLPSTRAGAGSSFHETKPVVPFARFASETHASSISFLSCSSCESVGSSAGRVISVSIESSLVKLSSSFFSYATTIIL